MQQDGRDEDRQGQTPSMAEGPGQAAKGAPEIHQRRRKIVGCLLQVYVLQLLLFGLLAFFVHLHPILPLDVAITHSFQQNQAPWLRITMLVVSYPGVRSFFPPSYCLPLLRSWRLAIL